MNQDVKTLQAERAKLYSDFYNNIIPKRMPISMMLPNDFFAHYGNMSPVDYQYDYAQLRSPVLEVADKLYSDSCIFVPVSQVMNRPPMFYQSTGSQSFIMGKGGMMQHPEVSGMEDHEYAELIDHPFDFLVEKVIPRQYHHINFKDNPINAARSLMIGQQSLQDDTLSSLPIYSELMATKGYYPGAPMGSMTFSEAPFDFVSDQLRGFSGASKDIRRHKSEMKEAAEAVLPLVYH